MKAPAKPANEALRLETLRALRIMEIAPEERFDRLTRLAKRLFGVPIALISLVDDEQQMMKSAFGLEPQWSPRDTSFCGHAILGDDIFLVPDALLDERFHDNPAVTGAPNIRFYAGCPLTVPNGSKLGTLCLIDREPRVLTDDDRELLRDLAGMAEQEIAAVQLATMDELTMLSNRRGFIALGQHAVNVCKRSNKPASMFFFDLNRFKQINDRFGHAEGDRALIRFSDALRSAFRDSDVVGRLGGDEFVVLLTNSDPQQAGVALKRLGDTLNEINAREQRGYDIAFSVGSMAFDQGRHKTIEDLIRDADVLMYQHKRGAPLSAAA